MPEDADDDAPIGLKRKREFDPSPSPSPPGSEAGDFDISLVAGADHTERLFFLLRTSSFSSSSCHRL